MRINWRVEALQWLILGAMFAVTAWAWSRVPAEMPVHWNIQGEPDRYGGRAEALLLVPLLSLGLYALLLVLPRFDPLGENYARFSGTYAVLRTSILAVMAVLQAVLIAAALGWQGNVGTAISVAVGALFVVLGAMMPRLEPTWFVGIRTPWTLSSRTSWDRTHRVGGWVFIVTGIAMAILGLIDPTWAFPVMLVGVLGGTLGLIAYSYWVWRTDPDKVPAAGVHQP